MIVVRMLHGGIYSTEETPMEIGWGIDNERGDNTAGTCESSNYREIVYSGSVTEVLQEVVENSIRRMLTNGCMNRDG